MSSFFFVLLFFGLELNYSLSIEIKKPTEKGLDEWKQYTSLDGREYFYNEALDKSSWIKPSQLVNNQHDSALIQHVSSKSIKELSVTRYFHRAAHRPSEDDITLALQCDVSRVGLLLGHAKRWKGPISVAILTTVHDIEKLTSIISTANSEFVRSVDIHVATTTEAWEHYPINKMRNIALSDVESKWVFVLDIDEDTIFSMSEYKSEINNAISKNSDINPSKTVFAITSWQYASEVKDSYPTSKSSLLSLWENKVVTTKAPHFQTAYVPEIGLKEWAEMKSAVTTPYHDLYEPYYIRRTAKTPEFDPQFVGWGGNKAIQAFAMAIEGYRFVLLPNVFSFVSDTPQTSLNHKPPANPKLPEHVWSQMGKRRGCDTCLPISCVKSCPWLLPYSSQTGKVSAVKVDLVKVDSPILQTTQQETKQKVQILEEPVLMLADKNNNINNHFESETEHIVVKSDNHNNIPLPSKN
eukprot:c21694_g1_i1.p1 GENE.c21694_g1_i1~~c21694_g1_i1.p1  ORF type:complete len:467 (+),score=133.66 c21694_g1_i1:2-1402(+)